MKTPADKGSAKTAPQEQRPESALDRARETRGRPPETNSRGWHLERQPGFFFWPHPFAFVNCWLPAIGKWVHRPESLADRARLLIWLRATRPPQRSLNLET